jgi:hypothetical protein
MVPHHEASMIRVGILRWSLHGPLHQTERRSVAFRGLRLRFRPRLWADTIMRLP